MAERKVREGYSDINCRCPCRGFKGPMCKCPPVCNCK